MKFRFCGGLDAPDWLLTEIAIVAKLSSQQMTFFTEQVIKQLLGKNLAYDKLEKLSQVVKFTRSDAKAALAAVNYVLDSATRYNVQRKKFSIFHDDFSAWHATRCPWPRSLHLGIDWEHTVWNSEQRWTNGQPCIEVSSASTGAIGNPVSLFA